VDAIRYCHSMGIAHRDLKVFLINFISHYQGIIYQSQKICCIPLQILVPPSRFQILVWPKLSAIHWWPLPAELQAMLVKFLINFLFCVFYKIFWIILQNMSLWILQNVFFLWFLIQFFVSPRNHFWKGIWFPNWLLEHWSHIIRFVRHWTFYLI